MVGISTGVFRVVLLTPKAKLMDCRAGSVTMPAYDGQWGILRNHCPVLTRLKLGILQIRQIADRPDAFYILEGGLARVNDNHLTILAYDVLTFEGRSEEEVREMVSEAQSIVVGQEYIRTQRLKVDPVRAQLVVRMARMAGVDVGSVSTETAEQSPH